MCCFPDQVLVLLRANFPSRAIKENDGNGRGALRDMKVMIRIMMIVEIRILIRIMMIAERYDGDDKDNDDCWILGSGDGFLHKIRFKRDQIGL